MLLLLQHQGPGVAVQARAPGAPSVATGRDAARKVESAGAP